MKRLPVALLWLSVCIGSFFVGRSCTPAFKQTDTVFLTDTVTKTDTVVVAAIKPVISTVLRIDTVKTATVRHDTVLAEIPVVQAEYSDSMYHAWVSGCVFASLDSLMVFPTTRTVTNTIEKTVTVAKIKRWGIGPQIGAGWNGSQWRPYIGIGVQYNLIGW